MVQKYEQEEMENVLQRFADDAEKRSQNAYRRWREQREERIPSLDAIIQRFGSWPCALRAAGVGRYPWSDHDG